MTVLLHICCGVCAAGVIERLLIEGYEVTGFFYGPNIHPEDEYRKRLDSAEKVARHFDIELVEAIYDREKWFEMVKGVEGEKEGGLRCQACFSMRLEKTFDQMKKKGFDRFATTLTVSPHKDAVVINRIGTSLAGDRFIEADFKKKGGFQRAVELAKEIGIYHQDYCGCIYSLEESYKRKKNKE
ncbi:MAG: epoxyqueuosine reductase QueH [Candidatus Omnitrophica bacterium]|nr:epoxyqueuosine reductase QueH [Candidatus Omnitrophota bacterium]MDD5487434.1 epoxyqueuosine reductase QueH [Candidatus Omnitrophota bacterium]